MKQIIHNNMKQIIVRTIGKLVGSDRNIGGKMINQFIASVDVNQTRDRGKLVGK